MSAYNRKRKQTTGRSTSCKIAYAVDLHCPLVVTTQRMLYIWKIAENKSFF